MPDGFEILNIKLHQIPSLGFQKLSLLVKAAVFTSSIFLEWCVSYWHIESKCSWKRMSLNVSKDSWDHFRSSSAVLLLPLLFLAGTRTNLFFSSLLQPATVFLIMQLWNHCCKRIVLSWSWTQWSFSVSDESGNRQVKNKLIYVGKLWNTLVPVFRNLI